jgi:hypothetical protein
MLTRIRVSSVALCATLCAVPCIAQSYTTYNVVASSAVPGAYGGNTYAVDLNNDGVADLVVDDYANAGGTMEPDFAVFIANGDGTFKAPVFYPYSPASIPPGDTGPYLVPMAFGDFNGDGNIDVAMPVGNHTIAVYLGKGDGTFANPWYSVIDLPSNQYVLPAYPSIVAADFNHDGKLDLAVVGVNSDESGETVYILPGEGNGLFSSAIPVLNVATPYENGSGGVRQILTGDFDGDTNADLAVEISGGIMSGQGSGSTTVHVLYGDGNFGFDDTTPITNNNGLGPLNVGDLNSDGKSDLFSIGGALLTWYGEGDRTFASFSQTLPEAGYGASTMPIGDFNGDGLNDIVLMAQTDTNSFLVFLLGTPNLGQFDVQTWNLPNPPATSGLYTSLPVAGNFKSDDQKPDWAIIVPSPPNNTNNSIAYTGLNATVGQLWSNCDYPSLGEGISLCSPAISSGSAVNFNATAHSFGDLRKIELWVDGKKLDEQYHTWEGNAYFSYNSDFAAGTHSGTYYAANFDNSLLRYNFTFTVPSSCSAPTSPGVHICAPADGSAINSNSVLVQATSSVTGTLARMEIWVDSTKQYTETTSTSLSAAVTASPGTHQFTVFAVNTDDTVWSQAVTATTQ